MEDREPRIFTISPQHEADDTLSDQDHSSLSGDEMHTELQHDELSPEVPPILQGHVFKRSSSGIGSKIGLASFKKRYFVLYSGVLLYYEHQSSYERDKHHELVGTLHACSGWDRTFQSAVAWSCTTQCKWTIALIISRTCGKLAFIVSSIAESQIPCTSTL